MINTITTADIRRIAEEVMGWDGSRGSRSFVDRSGEFNRVFTVGITPGDWNPRDNPADALEVLERLAAIMAEHFQSDLQIVEISLWSNERGEWGACIEYQADWIWWESAPGPHFGPAVCVLALKWLEKKNAK